MLRLRAPRCLLYAQKVQVPLARRVASLTDSQLHHQLQVVHLDAALISVHERDGVLVDKDRWGWELGCGRIPWEWCAAASRCRSKARIA